MSAESAISKCRYAGWYAKYVNKTLSVGDIESLESAALCAALECYQDGHLSDDGELSPEGKRKLCRDVLMTAYQVRPGVSCFSDNEDGLGVIDRVSEVAFGDTKPRGVTGRPVVDYGYADGRTTKRGPRIAPKDKHLRYRQRMTRQGRCPRCGKCPERFVLCESCREKKNKLTLASYHKKKTQSV